MTQDKEETEAGHKDREQGAGGPGHGPAAPRHDDHGRPHGPSVLGQDDVLMRPHSGAGQERRPSRLKDILIVILFLCVSSTALAVFIIIIIVNLVPDLSSRPGALANIAVLVIKTLGVTVATAVVSRVVGIF